MGLDSCEPVKGTVCTQLQITKVGGWLYGRTLLLSASSTYSLEVEMFQTLPKCIVVRTNSCATGLYDVRYAFTSVSFVALRRGSR